MEWCTTKANIEHSKAHMEKPRKKHKPSATGEKYIYFRHDKYRLHIKKLGVDKTFCSLEEALRERDRCINGKEYFDQ